MQIIKEAFFIILVDNDICIFFYEIQGFLFSLLFDNSRSQRSSFVIILL